MSSTPIKEEPEFSEFSVISWSDYFGFGATLLNLKVFLHVEGI